MFNGDANNAIGGDISAYNIGLSMGGDLCASTTGWDAKVYRSADAWSTKDTATHSDYGAKQPSV